MRPPELDEVGGRTANMELVEARRFDTETSKLG